MENIKFILATLLAFTAAGGFWYSLRSKNERFLKFGTVIGIFGKLAGVIIIYKFYPFLNQGSDAALYYFPQVQKVLAGKIPYIDFQTSYSIFFPFFFAPFVAIWHSVGAIVFVMVVIESLMMALYLWFGYKSGISIRWHVAFLYTFCPISVYWIMTGYNSIIIAFIALTALVLAEYNKDYFSGIIMAFGFLITKFLIVLTLPAVIFIRNKNLLKRILPLLLLTLILLVLMITGIDFLYPLKHEATRSTNGNLFFLISTVIPGIRDSILWNILPVIIFAAAIIPMFIIFVKTINENPDYSFDISLAFISVTILLFMIISKKTYPFYLQMSLLFIIHTIAKSRKYLTVSVLIIIFLGSITTMEPYLFNLVGRSVKPLFDNKYYIILMCIDFCMLSAYLILTIICFKKMLSFAKIRTEKTVPV